MNMELYQFLLIDLHTVPLRLMGIHYKLSISSFSSDKTHLNATSSRGFSFPQLFTVCNGLGTGELTHTLSINATNIDSFKNCTKINGNIAIIHTSIHG